MDKQYAGHSDRGEGLQAAATFGGFCKGEALREASRNAPPTTLPVVMTFRASQIPRSPDCICCDSNSAPKLSADVKSIVLAT